MFNQVLNPFSSVFSVWLVALVPVAVLLKLWQPKQVLERPSRLRPRQRSMPVGSFRHARCSVPGCRS
jgi:hypothetical protein